MLQSVTSVTLRHGSEEKLPDVMSVEEGLSVLKLGLLFGPGISTGANENTTILKSVDDV